MMRLVKRLNGKYLAMDGKKPTPYVVARHIPQIGRKKPIAYDVLKNGKWLTGASSLENAKAYIKEFLSYDEMSEEEKRRIANERNPSTYRIVETDETLLENREVFRGTYYDCFLHCRKVLYPKLEDHTRLRLFLVLWETRRMMFSDDWFMEFKTYGLLESRTLKRYKVEKVI